MNSAERLSTDLPGEAPTPATAGDGPPPARPRKATMPPRRRARTLALQALYPWLLAGAPLGAAAAPVLEHARTLEGHAKADLVHLEALISGVLAQAEALDAVLRQHADRPTAQLSPLERGMLFIGAYELAHCLDVPWRVAISEAIELAKSFGGTDGHKYINGVLDKAAPHWRAVEIGAPEVRTARGPKNRSAAPRA